MSFLRLSNSRENFKNLSSHFWSHYKSSFLTVIWPSKHSTADRQDHSCVAPPRLNALLLQKRIWGGGNPPCDQSWLKKAERILLLLGNSLLCSPCWLGIGYPCVFITKRSHSTQLHSPFPFRTSFKSNLSHDTSSNSDSPLTLSGGSRRDTLWH